MKGRWISLIAAASDLFLGTSCYGCGRPGYLLCPPCRHDLSVEPICGRIAGIPTCAALSYEPPWSQLIIAHKERGAWNLATLLGMGLATAVEYVENEKPPLLIPVPSSRTSIRQRGYDHAWALAKVAASHLGYRAEHLLERIGDVEDQCGLSREERYSRQIATMRIATQGSDEYSPLTGTEVIVVDDIITTGASVTEAVRALSQQGCHVVGIAAICQVIRR